jgi:hypothetical protein
MALTLNKNYTQMIEVISIENKTAKEILQGKNAGKHIMRYFLTTSRSYKSYILKSKNVSSEFKTLFVDKSMPKFIWVAEIMHGDSINSQNQIVDAVVILDATESGDSGNLIMAFNAHNIIWKNLDMENIDFNISNKGYSIVKINIGKLYMFNNNLKGIHTEWHS